MEEQSRDRHPDSDPPVLAAPGAFRNFVQVLGLRQHLPGRFQHHPSGVGELDLFAEAAEQLDPEIPFHIFDALRQRRLIWLASIVPPEGIFIRRSTKVTSIANAYYSQLPFVSM